VLTDAPVALERICGEGNESLVVVGTSSILVGKLSSSGSACCCFSSFSISQSSSSLSQVLENHRGASSTILSVKKWA